MCESLSVRAFSFTSCFHRIQSFCAFSGKKIRKRSLHGLLLFYFSNYFPPGIFSLTIAFASVVKFLVLFLRSLARLLQHQNNSCKS